MIRKVRATNTNWIGLIVVILSFCITSQSLAQEKTLLTLDDAMGIALEKSYSVKSLKLSLIAAEENLTAAKGRFRTNADMSIDAPSWVERVSRDFYPGELPVYDTRGSLRYQTTLSIYQPLPTDGTLSLRSNLYKVDESIYRTKLQKRDKSNEFLTSISLRFQQPLFTINKFFL